MQNQTTKILLFLLILFSCSPFYGQIEFIGSSDYGRIFNITYDPLIENKLYATSLNNHILTSDDNGENWSVLFSMTFSEVTEFQNLKMTNNNTALSFIKYNQDSPDNTLLIFDLATNAIVKEIQIPGISNVNRIEAYAIYPQDTDIILMNTVLDFGNEEFTYYTTDGGINWDIIYSKNNYDGVSLNNIAINPENPQHLILTRGFGPNGIEGGMLISLDGGQTWELKLEDVILNPIAFNPFSTNEIYVGTGMSFGNSPENLYRSIDSGETWEVIPLMWTEGNLDNINYIAFNPINEGHIIVLEENEIVVSTDNGVSWQSYVYDLEAVDSYYSGWNLSFNPFNENEVFINGDYVPLFSEDGGNTTTWKKNNYFRSTGNIGLFSGIEKHLYYGVQYGYVHRTLSTQNEESFDILPLNAYSQGDAPALFVDKTLEGRVFVFIPGWMGANFKVSNDHGQTKHQIKNTYLNYVDAVAVNPMNSNEVWYSLSSNMGEIEFWKADLSDINNISSTAISVPEEGIINGIYFDRNISGKGMVAIGTNVYKTQDNGNTWTISSSGLEELIPNSDLILNLTSDPLNQDQYTLSTSQGVFTSFNGGDNWIKIYDGLVHKVYHSTITAEHMVGIVFDTEISEFTIIYSTDSGDTWEQVESNEVFKTAVADATVSFQEESAEVYIGSIDLGLMKYTLDLSTLGLDSRQIAKYALDYYPNPVKNNLTLRSELKIKTISIYNITGQQILFKNINDSNTNIDISALPSGIYLLQVENAKSIQSIRIIKE